jgi:hypothetical protein
MLQWRYTAVLVLIALAAFAGLFGVDPGSGWSWA